MIRALRLRPSARLRLTATFAALFLLAGALLLALVYLLVQKTLPSAPQGFNVPTGVQITQQLQSGGPGAGTIIAVANQVQQQVLLSLLIESGVALALMAIISTLLGWIMAGRVLSPVHQITATARRLSQDTLHERIALTGPNDEIKELADTFDAMLARLDRAFDSQQRFVANASHELRTPLATQRALVDVNLADPSVSPAQLRATLEKIRDVTDESEHLIKSLLALARSERGLERSVPVDLAVVAKDATEERQLDGISPLQLKTVLEPAVVNGDRSLLERMVGNLLDNAVRYNLPGGWINVVTGANDGHVFVRVSNSGDRIPTPAAAGLFTPFHRLDGGRRADRGGAGLGLSIVRAIAYAHHGQANAMPIPDGGLEVVVSLPSDDLKRGAAGPTTGTNQPQTSGELGTAEDGRSGEDADEAGG